ncbi:MAG: VOC family protein [Candidatus Dormiibacterota bacterium]|jgi:predicted enzyme related to lactoylglutathione lyase
MTARLAHFEILGPDDRSLVAFYHDLLGWPTDSQGPGYTLVHPEGGPGGAIVESPDSRVTLGVTVADLDATVARVRDLGGQILMPPTDNGWVTRALVTDPGGNALSLIQDRPSPGR